MFDRILLPVDGSDTSQRAQQYAKLLAGAYDAEIHALFVLEEESVPDDGEASYDVDQVHSELRETADETLESAVEAYSDDEVEVVTSIVAGHPTDEILEYVAVEGMDLIVLGMHPRGRLSRFLRESVTEQVVQSAPVPVLTVRPTDEESRPEINKILLGTDGSDSARQARTYAFDLATAFDGIVHALYVIESRFRASGALHDLLERESESVLRDTRVTAAQAGLDVVPATREGKPEREITEYATKQGVDLIVLGTHGRTGLDRFVMGSVATSVVRSASQPVLTVRSSADE